jgi:hypothetical protein
MVVELKRLGVPRVRRRQVGDRRLADLRFLVVERVQEVLFRLRALKLEERRQARVSNVCVLMVEERDQRLRQGRVT